MTGGVASPEERAAADKVCAPRELETWRLRDRGLSIRSIALALRCSTSTVRSALWNADRKIAEELEPDPEPDEPMIR